ncbi:hypothetical protein JCM10212_000171 [Sporobolomyces blumeae]
MQVDETPRSPPPPLDASLAHLVRSASDPAESSASAPDPTSDSTGPAFDPDARPVPHGATYGELAQARQEWVRRARPEANGGEPSPVVTLQVKASVPAVHRLGSSELSEQTNFERYGHALGVHGHVYDFTVTFRGPLCPKTGQTMGLDLLEEVLPLSLVEPLANKDLDRDLSYFLSRPSTLENVCLFAWRNVQVVMAPHPMDVVNVAVETKPCPRNEHSKMLDKVRVEYSGETVNLSLRS